MQWIYHKEAVCPYEKLKQIGGTKYKNNNSPYSPSSKYIWWWAPSSHVLLCVQMHRKGPYWAFQWVPMPNHGLVLRAAGSGQCLAFIPGYVQWHKLTRPHNMLVLTVIKEKQVGKLPMPYVFSSTWHCMAHVEHCPAQYTSLWHNILKIAMIVVCFVNDVIFQCWKSAFGLSFV